MASLFTPRQFAARRHSPVFTRYKLRACGPEWRSIGRGLIAACDGSEKQIILPGMVFGVEIRSGKPVILSYACAKDNRAKKPITLSYAKSIAAIEAFYPDHVLEFEELIELIRTRMPKIYRPSKAEWFAVWGLAYDEETRQIENPRQLCESCT